MPILGLGVALRLTCLQSLKIVGVAKASTVGEKLALFSSCVIKYRGILALQGPVSASKKHLPNPYQRINAPLTKRHEISEIIVFNAD